MNCKAKYAGNLYFLKSQSQLKAGFVDDLKCQSGNEMLRHGKQKCEIAQPHSSSRHGNNQQNSSDDS